MTILLIRHATVDKNSPAADTLTEQGLIYSEKLGDKLQKEGLTPEIVFFDNSAKGDKKEIERCFQTVSSIHPKKGFKGFNFHEASCIMKECQKFGIAAICYTSESLKYYPKLIRTIIEDYTGEKITDKLCEKISDYLYENIIVICAEGDEYTQLRTIRTGDYK